LLESESLHEEFGNDGLDAAALGAVNVGRSDLRFAFPKEASEIRGKSIHAVDLVNLMWF